MITWTSLHAVILHIHTQGIGTTCHRENGKTLFMLFLLFSSRFFSVDFILSRTVSSIHSKGKTFFDLECRMVFKWFTYRSHINYSRALRDKKYANDSTKNVTEKKIVSSFWWRKGMKRTTFLSKIIRNALKVVRKFLHFSFCSCILVRISYFQFIFLSFPCAVVLFLSCAAAWITQHFSIRTIRTRVESYFQIISFWLGRNLQNTVRMRQNEHSNRRNENFWQYWLAIS